MATAAESSLRHVHVVADVEPLCVLAVRPLGVALAIADTGGADVKGHLTRTRSGDYLAVSYAGDVHRWNAQGDLIGRVAMRGPGPLAFRAAASVYVDLTDSIHISDPPGRWHVLSPDGRIVRTIRGPSLANRESVAFLDNGQVLVAVPNPPFASMDRRYVLLDRRDGTVLKAFDARQLSDPLRDARLVAYGGGDRFWAASPTRYELELWSVAGTRLGGIRRRVAWFRDTDEGLTSTSGARILYLNVDHTADVLWATIIVFERPRTLEKERVDPGDYSIRVEAFSTTSGELLVSERFVADPLTFFPGVAPGIAHRLEERPSGVMAVELVEYRFTMPDR